MMLLSGSSCQVPVRNLEVQPLVDVKSLSFLDVKRLAPASEGSCHAVRTLWLAVDAVWINRPLLHIVTGKLLLCWVSL
jgi:hypothetical protein